jgi:NAD(P)H dehydrogenase (quinone)
MTSSISRFLVTGASGQLGRLVIASLLERFDRMAIVAFVRDAAKATDLAALGIEVREGDYTRPDTLDAAIAGVKHVLLISSNELGQRTAQHRNVIEASARAGVKRLVYTSVLHADTSTLGLAEEHRQTEALLRTSGVPAVILRNGWYTENYAASIAPALANGAFIGSAKQGLISSAARADYAEAAAIALTRDAIESGAVYELAGDDSYTLAQFAAEISRQSGKAIPYVDMPEAEFREALIGAGLPEPLAALLADSDAAAAQGALFDDGRQLSTLIGRPTTPLAVVVQAALPV